MKIAIDIDGVLADFTPGGIRGIVNGLWPGKMPEGYQPSNWDHTDILSKEQWKKIWKVIDAVTNFWTTLKPYEENVKALAYFLTHYPEVDVFYVTARQDTSGDTTLAQTWNWLTSQSLIWPQTSIITTAVHKSGAESKAKIYDGIGIDYSIDDRTSNVVKANEIKGHNAFLLSRNWNKHDNGVGRFDTLEEFLSWVSKKL